MRNRSEVLTLLGVFVGAALIFGGSLLSSLPRTGPRGTAVATTTAIVSGIVFGAVAVVLIRLSWRRHGGRAAVLERSRAVKDGVLPPSADQSWLPGLRARRQNAAQFRWLFPGLFVLMLIIGFVHLEGSAPVTSVYWFCLSAVMLGFGIYWFQSGPRDARVLDRFIADIEARSHP